MARQRVFESHGAGEGRPSESAARPRVAGFPLPREIRAANRDCARLRGSMVDELRVELLESAKDFGEV